MIRRDRSAVVALALLLLAPAALAQDVLVVAPKDFQSALDAWKAHRARQGLAVEVDDVPADVGRLVKDVSAKSGGKLRFVVLVGDVDRVPCAMVVRKGDPALVLAPPAEEIATDAPFADLDGDGVPDLAIGRVTADTADEARAYFDRVVAYETSTDFGAWRRRLNVVAGTGGFGPMVDAALENLSRQLLAQMVPPAVDVTMTYANPFSPFCPPPAEFADVAVRRFSEGALVVAYVGHGSERAVDRVRYGEEQYPIFDLASAGRVASEHGAPLAVFVACSTGHMDGAKDCLAEELLRRPKGPIGVIASSRISSPYSNGIVAKEMLDALYAAESPTTGELLLALKRRLVAPAADDPVRAQLEKMGKAMFEKDDEKRRKDREDHLALYNLFGDPCVRFVRPVKMPMDAPAQVVAGTKMTLSGSATFDGTATIELVGSRKSPPKASGAKTTPEEFRAAYEKANDRGVAKVGVPVKDGKWAAELAVPADTPPGPYTLRIFVEGEKACGAGGSEVAVVAAPEPPAQK